MRMIDDAKAGKIQYILVKSISRFSRNTVDALKYVRELKQYGVSVFFDEEKLDTWSSVLAILKNEIYVGDRFLQKTAPQNYLTKKPDPSVPYDSKYVYADHEGVVSAAVWDAVQERLIRTETVRRNGVHQRCTAHFLYGRVFCAECGEPYRRFTAKRVSGYYKTWRCRGRSNGTGCGNRHIVEEELISAINEQMGWNQLDEWVFGEAVKRITIEKHGIKIEAADGQQELDGRSA